MASELLALGERPPEPLAPSPQSLGIWELAWPTIAAAGLQTLVRWADVKMVGDLGREAIAAVTAGGNVYWFVQSVVMAVTTGLVALLGRAYGAGERDFADRVLHQAIALGTAFGLVTGLLGMPLARLGIAVYGVEDAVVELGAEFLFWLLVGNVPFTLTFVFGAALRAAGDTRTPLWIGMWANLLNVFLNWMLIYGNLGAPALGVAGSGIASSLAMLFQVVAFALLWRRGRLVLARGRTRFALELGLWRRILRVGWPAAAEGAAWHLGLLAFMRIMSGYGTAEFAAYNIGAQILALSFLPGFGFESAASTLVAQHLGDGRPERAARSGWRALAGAVVCMTLLGVITIAAAEPIARFFIDDDEVVALTVDFIWILGAVQPLMAVQFTLGGALRGAGDTRFPFFAVLAGLFGVRCALAALFTWWGLSVEWIFSALIGDYVVKASILVWRFRSGRWQTTPGLPLGR
jgi:putative MATE family efflux protein